MYFLVFDGMNHLDVAGPAEAFAEAGRLGAPYNLHYVSPDGDPVRTSIGAEFSVRAGAAVVRHADTVVVPGGSGVPKSPVSPRLLGAVEHLVSVSDRIVSVCTGAFLLAATGALDHRRATTHWQFASLLEQQHPDVAVSPDALFVHDGNIHTSAGVTAGIDLALSLIEHDRGSELAREVARQLVVYMQRQGGQSQYSTMLQLPRGNRAGVRVATDAVIADPAHHHNAQSLARMAGVSVRQLARLFETELGTTPARYVEKVRLETAKGLLLNGESVANTARRSGFGSPETMRRVFTASLGMPPRTYQARFSTTA